MYPRENKISLINSIIANRKGGKLIFYLLRKSNEENWV